MCKDSSHQLVTVVVLGDRDEPAVLALAASLAIAAGHPLGAAICNRFGEQEIQIQGVNRSQTLAANGVAGLVDGHEVILGNSALFAELRIPVGDLSGWAERLGQSVTYIAVDGNAAGFFGTRCV
jgi:Cu+-exporting ATPase